MPKTILLILLSVFSTLSVSAAPVTYTTSKGAVFTQVEGPGHFGKAWRDPSGTIWSSYQGDYSNEEIKPDQNNVVVGSPATEACAKIGGILPTREQYEKLGSYFELTFAAREHDAYRGIRELFAVFPDKTSPDNFFWTSSIVGKDDEVWAFVGYSDAFMDNPRYLHGRVRCVAE
jgi:hypothetical protein